MKKRIFICCSCLIAPLLISATVTAATLSCDSCTDCTAKISSAATGDTVELQSDIGSVDGSYCVDFGSKSGITFDGNGYKIFYNGGGYRGIYFGSSSASGNVIRNVKVSGYSTGVYMYYAGSNRIEDSEFTGNSTALYLYLSNSNTIENTNFTGNSTGIYLYQAHTNIFDGLTLHQNFTGIQIGDNSDGNVIRNSFITKNHNQGVSFYIYNSTGNPENNQVYNNVFNNPASNDIEIETNLSEKDRDLSAIPFILQQSQNCDLGANIMGCGCLGGNYWGLPDDSGYSQSCSDADGNGICDESYTIAHASAVLTDALPLTVPPAGCCDNTDRDGDGYTHAVCGGNDADDDPILCGADCYPGATEVCDGYDNDGDQVADRTVACEDELIYKDNSLPEDIAHQSCVYVPSKDMFYCFGGSVWGSPGYKDTIVKYDPENDSVVTLNSVLPAPRSKLSCSYAPTTNRIYCFGGYSQVTICDEYDANGGCIRAHSISTRFSDIVEFNPEDESVTSLSLSLPANVDGVGSIWSKQNNSIFLFGGSSSIHSGNRDWIMEFDPVAQALRTSASVLPTPRYGVSCAANSSTGKVYCFGGYGESGAQAEILEYDPSTDSLQTMATSLVDGMHSTPCVEDSVANMIYCLAGRTGYGDTQTRIMAYNPQSDSITQKSAEFIQSRYGHSCVEQPTTNKIYCFGGASNIVNRSEIVEYTPYLPIIGDIDDSGSQGLDDLIHTLQVLVGVSPAGTNRKSDISGNREIGMEEALYILRKQAGL